MDYNIIVLPLSDIAAIGLCILMCSFIRFSLHSVKVFTICDLVLGPTLLTPYHSTCTSAAVMLYCDLVLQGFMDVFDDLFI